MTKTYKTYRLTQQDIESIEANECRCGSGDVCAICGRPMKSKRIWLHLMPDGMLVDDPNEEIIVEECAEMGYFEVGETCFKKKFLKNAIEMTKEEILSIQ